MDPGQAEDAAEGVSEDAHADPDGAGEQWAEAPGDLLAEAARCERLGLDAVLCTVVAAGGSTPRSVGARMIVYPDGCSRGTIGGGALEAEVVRRSASGVRLPEVVSLDLERDLGMACGGRVSVLLEPLGAAPEVVLFGAGHVAHELAPLVARVGFRLAVVDDVAARNTAGRFPAARLRIHSFDPADWSELRLDRQAYAVIVTRDHERDLAVLRALAGRELGYVGLIGSRRKAQAVRAALRDEGVDEAWLQRLHVPVGLDIGAETPAEIAVSIVAQLVRVRRSGAA
jgi:xanthine dehydrogenase accessory factor